MGVLCLQRVQLFLFRPAGPIPALMITEIFLQSSRSSAYMVGGSVHWLCNFTVGLLFPFIQVSVAWGPWVPRYPHAGKGGPLPESEPGSPSRRGASGPTASSFLVGCVVSPPSTCSW